MTKVKAIPEGYHSVTPYLIVNNASKAIEFYTKVFGAKEFMRMEREGKIAHAELELGTSKIMLADECEESHAKSPHTHGGSSVGLLLYVEDVDNVFAKALACGAKEIRPLTNMFYGDRSGTIEDISGHQWTISTHIEDVTPEEMEVRMAEFQKN
ncbi:MAG: VOC family protein [Gammaproteobacteria bacterium]|nr:VOC family protein [Gammaproteobacteria bacterium]